MIKKIFIAAAVMAVSFSLNCEAQKLKDALKKAAKSTDISSVVESVTGVSIPVNIEGSWKYTGAAIALKGDNIASNVAGTALTAGFEQKMNDAFSKVGIKEGMVQFTFNGDKTFSCKLMGIPLKGTWSQNTEDHKVTLIFGGEKLKMLSITGYTKSLDNGFEILFEADNFLDLLKKVLSSAGKSTSAVGSISQLATNYKGLQLGFKLGKA